MVLKFESKLFDSGRSKLFDSERSKRTKVDDLEIFNGGSRPKSVDVDDPQTLRLATKTTADQNDHYIKVSVISETFINDHFKHHAKVHSRISQNDPNSHLEVTLTPILSRFCPLDRPFCQPVHSFTPMD